MLAGLLFWRHLDYSESQLLTLAYACYGNVIVQLLSSGRHNIENCTSRSLKSRKADLVEVGK